MTPHICVVHNNVDRHSSIGMIARWNVTTALEQGWRVAVVAHDLEHDLRGDVDWLRLSIPRVPHLGQWLAARPTIRRALDGRSFDILHVHQAQVAAMANVWQVHYLSRPARDHNAFAEPDTPRGRVLRIEQHGVMLAEDAYLKRLHRASTRALFVSDFLRNEFARHYRLPLHHDVLQPPLEGDGEPPLTAAEQASARDRLVGKTPPGTTVLGFLGGLDVRKGYRELLEAVAVTPDVVLLFAGSGSDGISDSRIGSRLHGLGFLSDLRAFFSAIDALVVPSRFDPCPLVVLDAWSRGVPVVCSPYVGTRGTDGAGASLTWVTSSALSKVVARLRVDPGALHKAALGAYRSVLRASSAATLIAHWERAMETGRSGNERR